MGNQKRSENTYTKINTIFLRDENNVIMPYDEFVAPEIEWLRNCIFDADEKIDGTNIRIEVTRQIEDNVIVFISKKDCVDFCICVLTSFLLSHNSISI